MGPITTPFYQNLSLLTPFQNFLKVRRQPGRLARTTMSLLISAYCCEDTHQNPIETGIMGTTFPVGPVVTAYIPDRN